MPGAIDTVTRIEIERVEAIPFSIPLTKPSKWGTAGLRRAADHVLIRVFDRDGGVGIAEATPRPNIHGETQASVCSIVDDYLAPRLVGRDAFDRLGCMRKTDEIAGNPTAKGAIDLAIHDLVARRLGITVSEFLGGNTEPLRLSFMVALGTEAEMLEEATGVREATGITAFKLKIGESPAQDLARVRALRKEMGDDAFISVDANQLYEPHTAVETLNIMADEGVAMAEEPVSLANEVGRRWTAERIRMPLLADDSVETLGQVRHELALGAASVIGIKPPRSGVTKSAHIAQAARLFGLPCWIGSQGVSGIGTLPSAHVAAGLGIRTYPADLGNSLKQKGGEDLLAGGLTISNGYLDISSGPGYGADVDTSQLKRFRVDK